MHYYWEYFLYLNTLRKCTFKCFDNALNLEQLKGSE